MESTIALAVARNVWSSFIADRQRRGSPHLTGAFVADIDGFSGRIRDGIVGPRRQLIFMAIERPGVPRTGFRNEEAKRRIRNHVDPRRGSPQTFSQDGHIFAALIGKSTQAVEKIEGPLGKRHVQTFGRAPLPWDGSRHSFCPLRSSDLLGQRATPAEQDRSRDGLKQRPLLRRDEIRP